MTTSLVRYEAACRAVAECKAVDEVKAWADKAAAMQAYGRMAKDKTLEVDAAEIRIRAERRLGEMLAAQKAEGGLNRGTTVAGNKAGAKQGSPVVVGDDRRPKLADAGISKDLSSRAQKLAAVPEAEFEAEVGEWRERVSAEGARVSAKLEAAGERELKKRAQAGRKAPAPIKAQAEPEDPDLAQDPAEVLEEFKRDLDRAENRARELEGLLNAEDAGKKLLQMQAMVDQAIRARDDAMHSSFQLQNRVQFLERELRTCGRAVGVTDLDQIPRAVQAFVRQHKVSA
jgi:hypothetical protein